MEEQNNNMADIYFPEFKKTNWKLIIGATAAALIIIFVIIYALTRKEPTPQPNDFVKKQIDSLAKANAELQAKHAALDSASKTYEDAIIELDWKVQNVGEKKTIIREYYHDRVKEPSKYTPKQVDSFFKKRYNY